MKTVPLNANFNTLRALRGELANVNERLEKADDPVLADMLQMQADDLKRQVNDIKKSLLNLH